MQTSPLLIQAVLVQTLQQQQLQQPVLMPQRSNLMTGNQQNIHSAPKKSVSIQDTVDVIGGEHCGSQATKESPGGRKGHRL